jgi:hypothetical protein
MEKEPRQVDEIITLSDFIQFTRRRFDVVQTQLSIEKLIIGVVVEKEQGRLGLEQPLTME